MGQQGPLAPSIKKIMLNPTKPVEIPTAEPQFSHIHCRVEIDPLRKDKFEQTH